MKVASYSVINKFVPTFKAMTIDEDALPKLKLQGQDFVNKLAKEGAELAEYKHYDFKIKTEQAIPTILSKDGTEVYKKFFHAAIPYGKDLTISTIFDGTNQENNIKNFIIKYDSKSEALAAYNKLMAEDNQISKGLALTYLLEVATEDKYKKTKDVDVSCLKQFIG